MSLILFDGFDGQTSKASILGGSSYAAGRFGGSSRMHDGQDSDTVYTIPVADRTDEIIIGCAQYPDRLFENVLTSNNKNISFSAGGNIQLTFPYFTDGSISARLGGIGTSTLLGQTDPGVVVEDTWGYLEIRAVLHASAGIVQVRYNNELLIDLSGISTIATGSPTVWEDVRLRMSANSSSDGDIFTDDLYILNDVDATATQGRPNNTFLGDSKVVTLVPVSDATPSQWTPSTGSDSYAVVDEIPANTTDYIADSTPGNIDMMNITLPDTTHQVYGVQVESFGGKDDAGAIAYRHRLDSGGTVATGPDLLPPAASFSPFWDKFDLDPDGDVWTPSVVDALLVGVETRSG